MFVDTSIQFSVNQAITATANATNLVDITGAGSGNAPTMVGGNGNVIGADWGAGDGEAIPYLVMTVTTAFVTAGSATMQVTLQCAPDNGSNVAGSYTVLYTSAVFSATQLGLGETLLVPIPPLASTQTFTTGGALSSAGQALPRFYQVVYTVATSTFSAGKVTTGILLNPSSTLRGTLYPNNFIVA